MLPAGPISANAMRRDSSVVLEAREQTTCFRPAPATCQPVAGGVATGKRLAAFDALRGGAMLLGVCLHGAIAYMPSRMPGLLWVVQDESTSPLFDVVFWWVHAFRLPLFFLVAGFFAQAHWQRVHGCSRAFIAYQQRSP